MKLSSYIGSRRGNVIVVLMVSAVVGIAITAGMRVATTYFKANAQIQNTARGSSVNNINLSILSEKFRINGFTVPTWYPDPYPTPSDLASGKRPIIQVLGTAAVGATAMVPTTSPTDTPGRGPSQQQFTLDSSQLASLLREADIAKDATGNPLKAQRGFVASTDLNQLDATQLGDFLRSPTSSWPLSGGSFKALQTSNISFVRFSADPANPAYAANLLVSVETTLPGSNKAVRSVASVSVDAPPDPNCSIALTSPAQPLVIGTSATFVVRGDSIAASGRISADNNATFRNLTMVGQSIRNLGTQTAVAAGQAFTVPLNPSPGTAFGGGRKWTIQASLTGIRNLAGPRTCSLDVVVSNPPPPVCTLTASPPKPKINEFTVLTLRCINQVTAATINGLSVPYNQGTQQAVMSFQKTTATDRVVSATATGPGGSTSTSVTLLGQCKYADPAYIQTNSGIGYARELSSGGVITYPFGGGYYYHGGTDGTGWNANGPDVYWACGQRAYGLTKLPNYICMHSGYVSSAQWWTVHADNLTQVEYYPADDPNCQITRIKLRPTGGGCFLSGTVLRDGEGNDVLIDQVRAGDYLYNPLSRKSVRVTEVTAGPETSPLWEVQVGDRRIRVTGDHPFLTDRGLLTAEALRPGDRLQYGDQRPQITEVKREVSRPTGWVWNVRLEGEAMVSDHFVLANGIPAGDLWMQNQLKQRKTQQLH